ncbi:hypothetical protein IJG93_02875 [Candidatus Saccharibacteria bacterium]|nr:hypothetical protein [Candidatus Saccharibacteria bacterium]
MILEKFRKKVREYHIMKLQQDYSPSTNYSNLDFTSGIAAMAAITIFIALVIEAYEEAGVNELTVALFIGLIAALFYLYMIIRANKDEINDFINFMLRKN